MAAETLFVARQFERHGASDRDDRGFGCAITRCGTAALFIPLIEEIETIEPGRLPALQFRRPPPGS